MKKVQFKAVIYRSLNLSKKLTDNLSDSSEIGRFRLASRHQNELEFGDGRRKREIGTANLHSSTQGFFT